MKKLGKLLALSLLCVPFAVKADMGAPDIREYEVIITSDNQIKCEKWEGRNKVSKTVTKGEKGRVYGGVDEIYRTFYTSDDYYCDIKTSDYIPVDSEVKPGDKDVEDRGQDVNIEIMAQNGVDVRKGPDSVYEKVGHIDKGAKLTYRYYATGESGTAFIYVEYNDVKGWINVLDKAVLFDSSNNEYKSKYITAKRVNTSCGLLERNMIFEEKKTYDRWSGIDILEYNGCEFERPDTTDFVYMGEVELPSTILNKDTKIYEYADTSSKVLATVGKGVDLNVEAEYYNNNGNSWNLDYLYVIQGGTKGWVKYDNKLFVEDDSYTTTTTTTESTTTTTVEEETTEAVVSNNNSKSKIQKTKETIIISLVVGIALALTAIVIILIVNKKKKVEAPKEEVKPEPIMTENDLNIVKEDNEENKTEEDKEESEEVEETTEEENKEDAE